MLDAQLKPPNIELGQAAERVSGEGVSIVGAGWLGAGRTPGTGA